MYFCAVTHLAKLCPIVNKSKQTLLETLITSKTRIRILLKFFLNPETKTHLRGLATELDESSNAVRVELNRLTEAGMLVATKEGNKLIYQVNFQHPLYAPVNEMIKQYVGVDEILANVIKGLGDIKQLYLSGSLARGLSTEVIDIVFVGHINVEYLAETIQKIELKLTKKIRYLIYSEHEAKTTAFSPDEFVLIYAP